MQVRAHYLYELDEVQRALQQLGEAVDQMVARALRAFRDNNIGAAWDTLRTDDEIDDRCYAMEQRALSLIAAQQPIATDLRFLLAAVQVATELERVGDYADGIATLVIRNADLPSQPVPGDVLRLGEMARDMLRSSINAFLVRDANAANRLEQDDDQVDALFSTILGQTQATLSDQTDHTRREIHALFVAHNLERIADRAVNIAERASFVATGTLRATHAKQGEHSTASTAHI